MATWRTMHKRRRGARTGNVTVHRRYDIYYPSFVVHAPLATTAIVNFGNACAEAGKQMMAMILERLRPLAVDASPDVPVNENTERVLLRAVGGRAWTERLPDGRYRHTHRQG